jgi:adenylate cyclase class IV
MTARTVKTPLDNEMACAEQETAVADRAQMHQAVLAMGFVPTVRIVKPAGQPWSYRSCPGPRVAMDVVSSAL